MSYGHYWYRIETTAGWLPREPDRAYAQLVSDTDSLLDAAGRRDIALTNGRGRAGTSYGGHFRPEWRLGRDLVHAVFGPEGAPNPIHATILADHRPVGV